MADSRILKHVTDQYTTLNSNFQRLYQRCTDDRQRERAFLDRVAARDNWYEAQNRVFRENDDLVQKEIDALAGATQDMQDRIQALADIAATLDAISAAINLASRVIVVAGTA